MYTNPTHTTSLGGCSCVDNPRPLQAARHQHRHTHHLPHSWRPRQAYPTCTLPGQGCLSAYCDCVGRVADGGVDGWGCTCADAKVSNRQIHASLHTNSCKFAHYKYLHIDLGDRPPLKQHTTIHNNNNAVFVGLHILFHTDHVVLTTTITTTRVGQTSKKRACPAANVLNK